VTQRTAAGALSNRTIARDYHRITRRCWLEVLALHARRCTPIGRGDSISGGGTKVGSHSRSGAVERRIRIENSAEFDYKLALAVRQHEGPVWIHGLNEISPDHAGVIAGHCGALHLPDLVSLSTEAAINLARHLGELHLDNLDFISDEGLRAFIPHPDLWIPEDVNDRINALAATTDNRSSADAELDSDSNDERPGSDQPLHPEDAASEDYSIEPDPSDEDEYDELCEDDTDDVAAIDIVATSQDDGIARKRDTAGRFDVLLQPLEQLLGLDDVKATIRGVVAMAHVARQRRREGLSVAPVSYHMAFFGPPGTGKTTVARLVADILRNAGVLARGHLVETDGQGLVAKYLGQTGHRVKEIVERSLGGVLFIDEAYSLCPREGTAGAYASEAIATLVPLLETHREDLVVILAGYEEEMNDLFMANPGLRSRIAHHMVFPQMDTDQLEAVYEQLAAQHGYLISTRFKGAVRHAIEREQRIRGRRFANDRAVRTLFETTLRRQAERLAGVPKPSVAQLQSLLLEDLPDQVA